MGRTLHQGSAIVAGYPWSMRLTFATTTPVFPAGVGFIADVKRLIEDTIPLTTLSTAAGSLVRVDDFSMDVFISGIVSASWKRGRVVLDFARADSSSYLGVMVAIPVKEPVTRPRP